MKSGRRLNDDDRQLLETLLAQLGPRIHGYARKLLGSREAEDVVAEVFARAADNIDSLRRCERPDYYLLAATRNLCRDIMKRRRPDTVPGEILEETCGTRVSSESSSRADDLDRLRDAVGRLPVAQREVVVLRMTAGLKFSEIAELLGVPLGTALSRMSAALERLKAEMGVGDVCRPAR